MISTKELDKQTTFCYSLPCISNPILADQVVLLTPSKSLHPEPLLSRQQSAPVGPLDATLMDLPASVANKRLTVWLNPLDATLTKNRGAPSWSYLYTGTLPRLISFVCHSYENTGGVGVFFAFCTPCAQSKGQLSKTGEMGTGARGAPVPEVGLQVKIKSDQSRRPGSRVNEGRVNFP